jgi:hypothetical protein
MLKQTCEGLKEVTIMQRVTPREFTPVEDTNEYLRKAAKKNKVLKYL